jgi:hypothetical protein
VKYVVVRTQYGEVYDSEDVVEVLGPFDTHTEASRLMETLPRPKWECTRIVLPITEPSGALYEPPEPARTCSCCGQPMGA